MELGGVELENVRLFPFRPILSRFHQILPTMLYQVPGGDGFSKNVGNWLRRKGVAGLIYPSARRDCGVRITNGKTLESWGWNFVDYRDSSPPGRTYFVAEHDAWDSLVCTGPSLATLEKPGPRKPCESVRGGCVIQGEDNGSWSMEGLMALRDAAIEDGLRKYFARVAPDLPEKA